MDRKKMEKLNELLLSYKKVAVAFSGGVDSSFLLKAAADVLGVDNVAAITIKADVNPEDEIEEASKLAEEIGVSHTIIEADVFKIPGFKENPTDRCYICKKSLFTKIINVAESKGIDIVIDGSNVSDDGDYRPGMRALDELNVKSPLKECGLTKDDVRELSRELRLHTWSKPSLACLASRIPYGEEITANKLKMIEKAEKFLFVKGFTQLRVRCHGSLARIEIIPSEMDRLFDLNMMAEIDKEFKEIGFKYVALDLLGYRTGSMNEGIV